MAADDASADTVFAEVFCRQPGAESGEARLVLTPTKEEVVIGRGDTCDFTVKCSKVSKNHLTLRWLESGAVQLCVPGSSGCYVNDRHLEKDAQQNLQHGDVVCISNKHVKKFHGKEPHCSLRIQLPSASKEMPTSTEETSTPERQPILQELAEPDVGNSLPGMEVKEPLSPEVEASAEEQGKSVDQQISEELQKTYVEMREVQAQMERCPEETPARHASGFPSVDGPWPKVRSKCPPAEEHGTAAPPWRGTPCSNLPPPPAAPPAETAPQCPPPGAPLTPQKRGPPDQADDGLCGAVPTTPVKKRLSMPRVPPKEGYPTARAPNSPGAKSPPWKFKPGPPPGPPPPSPPPYPPPHAKQSVPEPAGEPTKCSKEEPGDWWCSKKWDEWQSNSWPADGWTSSAPTNGWSWTDAKQEWEAAPGLDAQGTQRTPKVPDTPHVNLPRQDEDLRRRSQSVGRCGGRSRTPARGRRSPSRARSVCRSVAREDLTAAFVATSASEPEICQEAWKRAMHDIFPKVFQLDLSATQKLQSLGVEQAVNALLKLVSAENTNQTVKNFWRDNVEPREDRSLDDDALEWIGTLPREEVELLYKKLPNTKNPSAFAIGYVRRYRQEQQAAQSPIRQWNIRY